jgi:hypothetical protein
MDGNARGDGEAVDGGAQSDGGAAESQSDGGELHFECSEEAFEGCVRCGSGVDVGLETETVAAVEKSRIWLILIHAMSPAIACLSNRELCEYCDIRMNPHLFCSQVVTYSF